VNFRKNDFLMLNPSAFEIEQKCDMNSFWRGEWKRVKNDIKNFKSFMKHIFEII